MLIFNDVKAVANKYSSLVLSNKHTFTKTANINLIAQISQINCKTCAHSSAHFECILDFPCAIKSDIFYFCFHVYAYKPRLLQTSTRACFFMHTNCKKRVFIDCKLSMKSHFSQSSMHDVRVVKGCKPYMCMLQECILSPELQALTSILVRC